MTTDQRFSTWLDQTLSSLPYQKLMIPRIKGDILDVMRQSTSLLPKVGVPPTGGSYLLYLEGTIPLFFQGRQYNTPVNIFLPESYPRAPPVCYLTPTPGMIIKAGHRHVDASGLCYLPYLHEWRESTSNLVELAGHVSSIFGQDPPLRSVSSAATHTPPPPPPVPAPAPYYSTGMQPPPPYPAAYPPAQYPQPGPAPYSVPGYGAAYSTAGPYGSVAQPQPPPPPPPPPQEDPEVAAKRSLMRALAPRLTRDMQDFQRQMHAEFTEIQQQSRQLDAGQREIAAQLQQLEQERNQLSLNKQILQQKTVELTESLRQYEVPERDENVEILAEPENPYGKLALQYLAQDQAYDDAMRLLNRLLQRGAIDTPTFMKKIRFLSEDQFQCRVLRARALAAIQPQQQTAGPADPAAAAAAIAASYRGGSAPGGGLVGAR